MRETSGSKINLLLHRVVILTSRKDRYEDHSSSLVRNNIFIAIESIYPLCVLVREWFVCGVIALEHV